MTPFAGSPQATSGDLFDQIVEATRLHPAVAPFTVRRLLLRSGVIPPRSVTPEQLRAALPLLTSGLTRFLDERDFERAVASLQALTAA